MKMKRQHSRPGAITTTINSALMCTLLSATLLPAAVMAKTSCAPAGKAPDQVVSAIKSMFAAARADDLAAFNAVAEPEFYAFDGGRLFAGTALMSFIQQAHAAGKVFEWNVTEPQVHVSCNLAWITYVNNGSVQDSSGRQDVTWLESAILAYVNGDWRIRFLHSTRTPTAP
jgi:Domain of unknown function (DUF4440)